MKLEEIRAKLQEAKGRSKVKTKGEAIASASASSNPAAIQKLHDSLVHLDAAHKRALRNDPVLPERREIPIEGHYKDMAVALAMCPYELKQIMTHHYQADNELVMIQLKKFIMAVKISGEVDHTDTRKMLRLEEENWESSKKFYEKRLGETNKHNKEIYEAREEHSNEVYAAWATILIELVTRVERQNDLEKMSEGDRWMVASLVELTDANGASFNKAGCASLDFEKLKKLEPQIIAQVIPLANKKRKAHEEQVRRDFLFTAPIQELLTRMWHSKDNDEFDEIRQVIEWRREEAAREQKLQEHFLRVQGCDPASYNEMNDLLDQRQRRLNEYEDTWRDKNDRDWY